MINFKSLTWADLPVPYDVLWTNGLFLPTDHRKSLYVAGRSIKRNWGYLEYQFIINNFIYRRSTVIHRYFNIARICRRQIIIIIDNLQIHRDKAIINGIPNYYNINNYRLTVQS